MEEGVILVLQKPMMTEVGTLIGSPIAAGASSGVVGVREREHDLDLNENDRETLQKHVLRQRWLDDLETIVTDSLPRRLVEHVRESMRTSFYGNGLNLKEVKEPECFGFLLEEDTCGRVRVKPKWSFVHRKLELRYKKQVEKEEKKEKLVRMGLHGGQQFRPEQQEYGLAMGFVARYLDMTNLPECEICSGVIRIILEMNAIGVGEHVLKKVMKKLSVTAWFSRERVRECLRWSEHERGQWITAYDALEEFRLVRARKMCPRL